MQQLLDANDITAKFAAELTTAIFDKCVRRIAHSATISAPVVQTNLRDYSTRSIDNYSHVRTIVCDAPSRLLDIYQQTTFLRGNEKYSESEFIKYISTSRRASIRGHAGAGKSLFLRRHFLRLIETRKTIPILFDLRSLNQNYSGVIERIHRHARTLMPWMEYEVFRSLLKNGKIDLLLDGLDEVSHAIRPSVNSDIGALTREFPKSDILVTTRYGDRYETPGNVPEFDVMPFSKEQACSLIRSLDFPEENKLKFADALENGLYERSPDLLSNPLLCSIMLLTYKRFADVPPQLHIYYQQAYEVLFSRHDASKDEGFKRDFLSPLNVSEMQSVLSYFSAVTYAFDMFEFSENECLSRISEASSVYGLDARPEDIKDDLIEAISLIMRDGIELKFVHRSFQEYFTAYYISQSVNEIARTCIDAIKMRDDTDSVIPMSIALNESQFYESWLIPTLREDVKLLEADMSSGKHFSIVRNCMPVLFFGNDKLMLRSGVNGRSKSFNIYLRLLEKDSEVFSFDKGDLFDQPTDMTLEEYFRDVCDNLPLPKAFRESIRGRRFEVNTEDRSLAPLAEMAIWKPVAAQLLKSARLWLSRVEAQKRAQEASPLDAFRRAASVGARNVEGDLRGGLPRPQGRYTPLIGLED